MPYEATMRSTSAVGLQTTETSNSLQESMQDQHSLIAIIKVIEISMVLVTVTVIVTVRVIVIVF